MPAADTELRVYLPNVDSNTLAALESFLCEQSDDDLSTKIKFVEGEPGTLGPVEVIAVTVAGLTLAWDIAKWIHSWQQTRRKEKANSPSVQIRVGNLQLDVRLIEQD